MSIKIGSTVTLPAGTRIGMGKLLRAVRARVDQSQTASDGSMFYGVSWDDPKIGKRRTTWWAPDCAACGKSAHPGPCF